MKAIDNFFVKNFWLVLLGGIIWFMASPQMPEIKLMNTIVLIEILTLFLCQLAVYIHFKSPVTANINVGNDDKLNSVEQNALINSNSRIYLAVHILVGFIVVGVYFLNKGM